MSEDLRRLALKNGIEQLYDEELKYLVEHVEALKPVLLDRDKDGNANYSDGIYCPLAIAIGAHTHGIVGDENVKNYLLASGLEIYNTRGIEGSFYTKNRHADLLEVAKEVLADRRRFFGRPAKSTHQEDEYAAGETSCPRCGWPSTGGVGSS